MVVLRTLNKYSNASSQNTNAKKWKHTQKYFNFLHQICRLVFGLAHNGKLWYVHFADIENLI